jgi:hypothetical protein
MPKTSSTTVVGEPQDSITLKLGAKGEYSWEIKVYFMPEETAMTMRLIYEIDQSLWERYRKGF